MNRAVGHKHQFFVFNKDFVWPVIYGPSLLTPNEDFRLVPWEKDLFAVVADAFVQSIPRRLRCTENCNQAYTADSLLS
jgi:hypothetical protein